MKKLALIFGYLLSIPALAEITLKEGNLEFSSNCKVQVTKHEGYYHVRLNKDSSYSSAKIALANGEMIDGIDQCNEGEKKYPGSYHKKVVGQYLIYSAQCGGSQEDVDFYLNLVIDSKTGQFIHAYAENHVTRLAVGARVANHVKVKRDGELRCTSEQEIPGVEAFTSIKAIKNKLRHQSTEVKGFLSMKQLTEKMKASQSQALPVVPDDKQTGPAK